MKIKENALCDDRAWLIDHDDVFISYWGSGFLCCDACASIASARDAWKELA
jgi:hypothetical protein